MLKLLSGIQRFICGCQKNVKIYKISNMKGARVNRKGRRVKRKKSVKFKNKIQVTEIPTWKCWALRHTDLKIEFTYGPTEERIFIGHSRYEDIYCVVPPCSREESLQHLEDTMEWECVYSKKQMLLDTNSRDDVRHILSIFLLAYWTKIELEACDLVRAIHANGITLGPDDFEYENPRRIKDYSKSNQSKHLPLQSTL